MNLTRELKRIVYAKTDGVCWYCGNFIEPFGTWQIDHQQPISQNGSNSINNLVPSCRRCNNRKGGKTVEQYRVYLQARLNNKLGELTEFACRFVEEDLPCVPEMFQEFLDVLQKADHLTTLYEVLFFGETSHMAPADNGETVETVTAISEAVS